MDQLTWGQWFPPDWQQPERLLRAWRSGARLYTAWNGWLLVYPQPQRLQALGVPIFTVGEGWSSDPRLQPQPGQLALRWHGQIWRGDKQPADLSELWDWQQLQHSRALPPQIAPPTLQKSQPEPVRKILPAIPPPAPEREQFLRNLEKEPPVKNPLLGFFDLLKSFFGSPENQRYIDKMLRLFDQKNWQEALRHAIPINESSPGLQEFLGQLKPRQNLDFTPPTHGASTSTSLQGLDLLKSVYRKAYQQLIQAGQIDEAAFVLGELLGDAAGAVDLLEKHQRLEAAARLATLKGLPASLQVRLWFQAGQHAKAIQLARRYGVQAEALQILARKNPQLAEQFRAVWATDLADAGSLSQALSVGWPVRQRLEDYERWLRQALASPGPASLEALLHGLQDGDLCQRLQLPQKLEELFRDHDLVSQPRRRALLERLSTTWVDTKHPQLKSWAAETARRVMRQSNSPIPLGDTRVLEFLINLSGDPWLRVDRPATLKEKIPALGRWSETIDQQGLTPTYDLLWLGDGRLLVALGQAGLVLLSRNGGVAQRFAQPAYGLVAGERPLVLNGCNLSRLEGSNLSFWCQGQFDGGWEEHDGYHWLVWWGQQLYTVDLTAPDWRALYQYDLEAPPREVNAGAVLAGTHLTQLKLPRLEFLRRIDLPHGPYLCKSDGLQGIESEGRQIKLLAHTFELSGDQPRFRERGGFCLIETTCEDGLELLAFPLTNPAQLFRLKLPGATRLRARIHGWLLLVCDDAGRVLLADLRSRSWLARYFL